MDETTKEKGPAKEKTEEAVTNEASEKAEEVIIPDKFKNIVREIESMNVLDLSELVKILEKKFGVSAAAATTMTQAYAGGSGPETGKEAEEKSAFDVELIEAGSSKINVIKVVREATGVGLKDAKDLVDAAPKVIKEGISKEKAEELKKKIEEAGGKAELK